MRNDARPIGASDDDVHDQSPLSRAESEAVRDRAPGDHRDSVAHDRQSHIVNERAEDDAARTDADIDPVMPTGDSTLKTRI
jgi:hypothetical protein